jgi:hypothetical protein
MPSTWMPEKRWRWTERCGEVERRRSGRGWRPGGRGGGRGPGRGIRAGRRVRRGWRGRCGRGRGGRRGSGGARGRRGWVRPSRRRRGGGEGGSRRMSSGEGEAGACEKDFFRISRRENQPASFPPWRVRGRPRTDSSPVRVVRNAPSPENLRVIFARKPGNPRKKSFASTSCGRRTVENPLPPRPADGGPKFSMVWKIFFHGVEKWGKFSMVWKKRGSFPQCGKLFSTVWKIRLFQYSIHSVFTGGLVRGRWTSGCS